MTISLNKPVAGSQNWDVPVNANWDIIENALNAAAPIASPAFTGTPTTPTPSNAKDNSTSIPTTAWVRNHCCTTAATTTSTASQDAPAYVIKNYRSGQNWYRVWSDGWIEQGGYKTQASPNTISLLKSFTTTDYTVLAICDRTDATYGPVVVVFRGNSSYPKATTKFTLGGNASSAGQYWYACGY